jgi:hypothetical protein
MPLPRIMAVFGKTVQKCVMVKTRIIESSLKQIALFITKIQYSTQPALNCSKKVLQTVPTFLGLSRPSSGEKSKHILQYKDKIVV